MLRELHIRNLALIESSSVEFGEGLNVVTGETGAGKSIVVDSLLLLSGERASTDLIRSGCERMSVSGIFDLPQDSQLLSQLESAGALPAEEIVVRREVSREGRNRAYINDVPVTLRLLAAAAPHLIRVHTQREELGLAQLDAQRTWVDAAGGSKLATALADTRAACEEFLSLDQRWRRAVEDASSRAERVDLLRFQIGEIETANLRPGEEESLGERRNLLRHQDSIRQALTTAVESLYESEHAAGTRIATAAAALERIETWLPAAQEWRKELTSARLAVEDVGQGALRELEGMDSSPGELDAVESRLAELERLFQKYGPGSQTVMEVAGDAKAELETLEHDSENRQELENRRRQVLAAYVERARRLSAERAKAGEVLARAVENELDDLAMGGARLSVEVEDRPDATVEFEDRRVAVTPHGYDRVSLLLAANPGEPAGPLAKVASGGELSRIYLALQLAARGGAGADPVVLVFDEVDSGVGGAQADALGAKLRRLAVGGQILAVTHLPQVASAGHHHLRVEKASKGQRTRVGVEQLSQESRVEEIARMLAGREVTDTSRDHASELLAQAAT